jgi:hypothetical protein
MKFADSVHFILLLKCTRSSAFTVSTFIRFFSFFQIFCISLKTHSTKAFDGGMARTCRTILSKEGALHRLKKLTKILEILGVPKKKVYTL